MDEGLAAGSSPESGSQWLNVWMEISDEHVPQELVLEPILFNIFNYNNSGIECNFSKFADDTKVWGAMDSPEGWDAIQRDLDRLEQGAQVNLMKFSKSKCKILHLGQSNSHYQYNLGVKGLSTALLKKIWRYWWIGSWT